MTFSQTFREVVYDDFQPNFHCAREVVILCAVLWPVTLKVFVSQGGERSGWRGRQRRAAGHERHPGAVRAPRLGRAH